MDDDSSIRSSFMISEHLVYPHLTRRKMRMVAGMIEHQMYIDEPVPLAKRVELTDAANVRLNSLPITPILKMSKRKWVDAFFEEGSLQLGTLPYYSSFDHNQIGDPTEGSFLIIGTSCSATTFTQMSGGFNSYVFCTYTGQQDDFTAKELGYDDYYFIDDPLGFSMAVSHSLGCIAHNFASCVYSPHKAIVAPLPAAFDLTRISVELLCVGGRMKYFVKPNIYANQCEFRFLFDMLSDLSGPIQLKCPEARKFCSRP